MSRHALTALVPVNYLTLMKRRLTEQIAVFDDFDFERQPAAAL